MIYYYYHSYRHFLFFIVDCTWSEWKHGTCSVTCGEGTHIDTRKMFPEQFGGKPCEGEATQTHSCFLPECPGIE